MSTRIGGFPTVHTGATTEQIAQVVDRQNRGKFNATIDITLEISGTATFVMDDRLATTSVILLDPLTAAAAAGLATGNIYILSSNRLNRSCIITHPVAATLRQFRLLIIG